MRAISTVVISLALSIALSGIALPQKTAEQVVREKLPNGLEVVVVPSRLAPVVTMEINYLVGSNEAPQGFPGMAHAEEHMMFRGSEGLSADQLANIIAAMGGDFNADTQQTVTQYYFTVPAADLDVALHVEAVRMRGVLNSDELWRAERGAIEQEVVQDLSNPQYLFYTRLLDEMFSGTPYAHDALGTRPSFEKTTAAMLKQFHQTWYAPNNAILVIAGNVNPSEAIAQVKTLFGPIPSRTLPGRPEVKLKNLKPATMKLDTDLPYGMTVVAYRMPGYRSADFAAAQVLADVLDSQRADIYGLVPAGKALSAGFEMENLPAAGVGYAAAAYPNGTDGSALVSTLKDLIAGYVKNGVPEDLVNAAKRHEVADAEFEKNSIPGIAALWSQALAIEGRSSPEEDIKAIQTVTMADVNRVARQYLVNSTATVAILTPQPSGKPISSASFKGGESFAPKRAESVPVPDWAKKAVEPPSVPASGVNPRVFDLPNGLRLIVQPEKVSPTVTVVGEVKNDSDLQTPPGQEGVGSILDDLFSYGTPDLDRLAFQKALDDIAAEESAGTSFSLRVPAASFQRGMELLASNLLSPALPEEAFKVEQEQMAEARKGEMQSPNYLFRRALREALYPKGDPALRESTPASIASLRWENVKAYYKSVFRPDMTTIVVIGDLEPDQARAVVEKYFGGWKASGPKPVTDLPPAPLNAVSTVSVPDASRVQVETTLAETVGLTRSNPDYYPLQVASHVLAGAFYATRLYKDLREKEGLVYTVDDELDIGKTRSLFGVVYACDPDKVSKARAVVQRDLQEMATTPVSDAELQQAKTLLLRRIPLSEASTSGIAEQLLSLSIRELPLDEPIRAGKRYLETTAEDVRAVFAKWIRPAGLVQVTLGPNPK